MAATVDFGDLLQKLFKEDNSKASMGNKLSALQLLGMVYKDEGRKWGFRYGGGGRREGGGEEEGRKKERKGRIAPRPAWTTS
jgi:hypothetical protein